MRINNNGENKIIMIGNEEMKGRIIWIWKMWIMKIIIIMKNNVMNE